MPIYCILIFFIIFTPFSLFSVNIIDDTQILKVTRDQSLILLQNQQLKSIQTLIEKSSNKKPSISYDPLSKNLFNISPIQKSTVIISSLYQCNQCQEIHIQYSTGFFIDHQGTVLTCYHNLWDPKHQGITITNDQLQVFPITELIFFNQELDITILKSTCASSVPLNFDSNFQIGDTIYVLSHPKKHFYYLSQGMINRVYKKSIVSKIHFSAEIARGSSGAALLNQYGKCIGIVQTTESLYYNSPNNFQMSLRGALPIYEVFSNSNESE